MNTIRLDKNARDEQIQLLDFSKNTVLSNKKYIVVDAPPGIGKSYYAVMFMDWYQQNYDRYAQFDVLTNSKILQEQYTNDYNFMYSLWGKGSYTCDKYNTDCGTGSEWCKLQGTQCDFCPYKQAKSEFEMADVALTNFHLFLTYMIFMPMAWNRSSRVLIVDEAHELESVCADFITTKISKPLLKRNGFTDEETLRAINLFGLYPEDLEADDFVRILNDEFLPIAKQVVNRLGRDAKDGSIQAANQLQSLGNNMLKWETLQKEFTEMPTNWIVECELIKKTNKKETNTDSYIEFTAQPVWAYPYLEKYVWSKYDHVVLMSGTILDKTMFAQMNGYNADDSEYIKMESPFPIENRPIYYFSKVGKQTYKTKEITWGKQQEVLKKILKKHKNDKGIIHTMNYEIQGWVGNVFNENRILTHGSDNRNEVLQFHYNSPEPTVLVSPSMGVGVDLFDGFSRHQTMLKMPYPNLGSKKIKKRMDTNPNWFSWKTCVDFIQSYGRSIRSFDDHAKTYVLDGCFGDLLKWSGHYMPNWVKNAVHYID